MIEVTVAGHLTIDELIRKGESRRSMGGVACYASIAASRLGARVKVVSNVGRDFPSTYLKVLSDAGVDISDVSVDSTVKSTFFQLKYLNGERVLKLLSRAGDLKLDNVAGDAVYLGPVAFEITPSEIASLVRRHRRVLLDPQGMMRSLRRDGSIVLRKLDVSFPGLWVLRVSRREAEVLTGEREAEAMIEKLMELGSEVVALTLGDVGSLVSDGERVLRVPAFKTVEVDSTGAGDVFGGAFLVEYLRTGDLAWSAAVGSAMASVLVEGFGFSPLLSEGVVDEVYRRAKVLEKSIERI